MNNIIGLILLSLLQGRDVTGLKGVPNVVVFPLGLDASDLSKREISNYLKNRGVSVIPMPPTKHLVLRIDGLTPKERYLYTEVVVDCLKDPPTSGYLTRVMVMRLSLGKVDDLWGEQSLCRTASQARKEFRRILNDFAHDWKLSRSTTTSPRKGR